MITKFILLSDLQTSVLGYKNYIINYFLLERTRPFGLAHKAVPIAIKTKPINGATIRIASEAFLAPLIVLLKSLASSSPITMG